MPVTSDHSILPSGCSINHGAFRSRQIPTHKLWVLWEDRAHFGTSWALGGTCPCAATDGGAREMQPFLLRTHVAYNFQEHWCYRNCHAARFTSSRLAPVVTVFAAWPHILWWQQCQAMAQPNNMAALH